MTEKLNIFKDHLVCVCITYLTLTYIHVSPTHMTHMRAGQCRWHKVANCQTMHRVSRLPHRTRRIFHGRTSSRRTGRFIDPPRRHPSTGNKESTRQKTSRLVKCLCSYVWSTLARNKILKAGKILKSWNGTKNHSIFRQDACTIRYLDRSVNTREICKSNFP